MSESADVVVTLVHGTWARWDWESRTSKQRWPKMQAEIAEALKPKSVRIDANFTWSGRNSVNARHAATSSFKEYVDRLKVPEGIPYYVVAHSHGASVVAMALGDASLRKKVKGLVCLSTPFFHVRERNSRMRSEVFGGGLIAFAGLLAWLVSRLPFANAWTIAGTFAGAILAGLVVLAGLRRFGNTVLSKMHLPTLTNEVPVLVVRAPADDTTLPLTALQCIAWLAQWVYWLFNAGANLIRHVMGGGSDELKGVARTVATGAFVLVCVICFAVAVFQSGQGWTWNLLFFERPAEAMEIWKQAWRNAIGVAFTTILGSSGLALLAYLLAAVIAALTSVLVGRELAIAGLFMDASVETAPPGRCVFEQLSMSEAAPSGLQHATHSNPAAIARVAAWLKAGAPPPSMEAPASIATEGV